MTAPPPPADPVAARIAEVQARCEAATEGPWSFTCYGEKGEGAFCIGTNFGPGDDVADSPLCGELDMADAGGNDIDYYTDESVCECDYSTRDSYKNAQFIAHARSDLPWALAGWTEERKRVAELEKQVAELYERLQARRGDWNP